MEDIFELLWDESFWAEVFSVYQTYRRLADLGTVVCLAVALFGVFSLAQLHYWKKVARKPVEKMAVMVKADKVAVAASICALGLPALLFLGMWYALKANNIPKAMAYVLAMIGWQVAQCWALFWAPAPVSWWTTIFGFLAGLWF